MEGLKRGRMANWNVASHVPAAVQENCRNVWRSKPCKCGLRSIFLSQDQPYKSSNFRFFESQGSGFTLILRFASAGSASPSLKPRQNLENSCAWSGASNDRNDQHNTGLLRFEYMASWLLQSKAEVASSKMAKVLSGKTQLATGPKCPKFEVRRPQLDSSLDGFKGKS